MSSCEQHEWKATSVRSESLTYFITIRRSGLSFKIELVNFPIIHDLNLSFLLRFILVEYDAAPHLYLTGMSAELVTLELLLPKFFSDLLCEQFYPPHAREVEESEDEVFDAEVYELCELLPYLPGGSNNGCAHRIELRLLSYERVVRGYSESLILGLG